MRLTSKKVLAVCGLAAALALSGCGKKEKDDDEEEETDPNAPGGSGGGGSSDTVTVAGKLGVGSSLALAPTLDTLKLFCVTFEETPRSASSEFGTDGAFSVTLPKNVNFGCFVNDKTTNMPVATFVVASEGKFGGGSSSIALSGSVDLGSLTLGEDGTVQIPAATIEGNASAATNGIDVDALHGVTYTMECQNGGNAEAYAQCQKDLGGDGKGMDVFLRIMKGTEGGKDIRGMGVWANATAFANCGSIDMEQSLVTKLGEQGITLSTVSVGTFAAESACPRRGEDDMNTDADVTDKLSDYYALSGIEIRGGGFSFRDSDEHSDQSGNCHRSHTTAIEFTGTNDVMYGAFTSTDSRYGDCGTEGEGTEGGSFSVKFTKK